MSDGYEKIPEHCRKGLKDYIENGVETGGFLRAVIENNLVEAFNRADLTNQERLRDYAWFLYNHAPVSSWGSKLNYETWIKIGGKTGLLKRSQERLREQEAQQ